MPDKKTCQMEKTSDTHMKCFVCGRACTVALSEEMKKRKRGFACMQSNGVVYAAKPTKPCNCRPPKKP
jgi:hypothetical protein